MRNEGAEVKQQQASLEWKRGVDLIPDREDIIPGGRHPPEQSTCPPISASSRLGEVAAVAQILTHRDVLNAIQEHVHPAYAHDGHSTMVELRQIRGRGILDLHITLLDLDGRVDSCSCAAF